MEILDEGHKYIAESVDGGADFEIRFKKKSNSCVEHKEEYDGILTQELFRILIDRCEYLNDVKYDYMTADTIKALKTMFFNFERRAFLRKEQGVQGSYADHEEDGTRVPFTVEGSLKLPVGPDGHIIPTTPELLDGETYFHDGKSYPYGPAFFVDPETEIIAYTKGKGFEEGVAIKNLDWTLVKRYKKFTPLDDSDEDFGIF